MCCEAVRTQTMHRSVIKELATMLLCIMDCLLDLKLGMNCFCLPDLWKQPEQPAEELHHRRAPCSNIKLKYCSLVFEYIHFITLLSIFSSTLTKCRFFFFLC